MSHIFARRSTSNGLPHSVSYGGQSTIPDLSPRLLWSFIFIESRYLETYSSSNPSNHPTYSSSSSPSILLSCVIIITITITITLVTIAYMAQITATLRNQAKPRLDNSHAVLWKTGKGPVYTFLSYKLYRTDLD
ncbi:hypothetical protein L873DRAFT_1792647 [Choiromyces venosus 120613-1]|uniref:Uncharacterized protein n=1 Tax=Choiromyces venosus 120613-1 TaxID=1336337 RepID=A0A3N4J9B2_9PEZI|nr:hypothetical protein L873DRAFT_1792647 [Choiromyces venosus 120613-1]